MTPDELQKWCDEHPDYTSFKKECEKSKTAFLKEHNMTEEQLEKELRTFFHPEIK